MKSNDIIIEICLGSSCHSKGSYDMVSSIKEFISSRTNCKLIGTLCNDNCVGGPVIKIRDQVFSGVGNGNILKILKDNI